MRVKSKNSPFRAVFTLYYYDNSNMVHERGLEPPRPKALAPKASVSTNSTTRANYVFGTYIIVA